MSKKLLFLGLLTCYLSVDAVVIIVHGSFATDRTWWTTNGEFFKAVEKEAGRMGERVVPYCWSGHPSIKLIETAGQNLAWLILSYPRNERITVIAHSNGGNVVNAASRALFDPIAKICCQFSSRPIKEILDMAYAKLDDKPVATAASLVVPMPGTLHDGFDYSYTTRQSLGIKQAVDDCIARTLFKKQHIIDRVIYLGTPVELEHFAPQMDVIGTLVSLYSEGDKIQTAAGMFARRFPLMPRVTNIQAQVKIKGNPTIIDPGHSHLHSSLIGQWLLHIPEVLMSFDGPRNGFDQFEFNKNGTVIFDEATGPRYLPGLLKSVRPEKPVPVVPVIPVISVLEPEPDEPNVIEPDVTGPEDNALEAFVPVVDEICVAVPVDTLAKKEGPQFPTGLPNDC